MPKCLCALLCAMVSMTGCASFKESAQDAAKAALAEALPAIKEVGKELAHNAAIEGKTVAQEFWNGAKTDIGGAIGQIPALAAAGGERAAKATLEARIKNDVDLSQPEKDDLLKTLAASGGGFSALLAATFAYLKAKAAAKAKRALGVVVRGVEASGDAAAKVKEQVKAAGGSAPEIKAAITEAKAA